jgi:hypothetical protein
MTILVCVAWGSYDVPLGETVTLRVEASGVPPPQYQWLKDGIELDGQTSARLVIPQVPCVPQRFYSRLTDQRRHPHITRRCESVSVPAC